MSNNKINKLSNIIINKISINETINSVSCILKELFIYQWNIFNLIP